MLWGLHLSFKRQSVHANCFVLRYFQKVGLSWLFSEKPSARRFELSAPPVAESSVPDLVFSDPRQFARKKTLIYLLVLVGAPS